MLNIIRIFICRNVIGIVFGYFQKLNIIHIFIQSFFKSWILSFFQSRKHYSLISENNSFRILPPIHISRFWTCVSTPLDQRNKQKSMKQSKTYQTFKNGPMAWGDQVGRGRVVATCCCEEENLIIDYKYLKNIISSFDDTKLVCWIINVSRRNKTWGKLCRSL